MVVVRSATARALGRTCETMEDAVLGDDDVPVLNTRASQKIEIAVETKQMTDIKVRRIGTLHL